MSEERLQNKKTEKTKRHTWHLLAILFIIFVIAIVCCFIWQNHLWNAESIDEQLAAIEASLAIPESEDAGVAYHKLAEDYLPLPVNAPFVDLQNQSMTAKKPWASKDFPNTAAWLNEWHDLISRLLDISKMEKCRLPILSDRQQGYFTNPVRQMNGWTILLVRSANLDAGESRIDNAIEKYTCVLKMGSHLRQQPVLFYYNHGIAIESLLPARNNWKQDSKTMLKVQRLFEQKQLERTWRPRITDWRSYWRYWEEMSKSNNALHDHLERIHRYHLDTLAKRRRMYILIALRHYKNQTGYWPESLDRIKPPLAKEILTDPVNNNLLIYELTGEDFNLSSRGVK
jgi:hypothetical protein